MQYRLDVETLTNDLAKAITSWLQWHLGQNYKDLSLMFKHAALSSSMNEPHLVDFDADNKNIAKHILSADDDKVIWWKLSPWTADENKWEVGGEKASNEFHAILLSISKQLRAFSRGTTNVSDNSGLDFGLENTIIPFDNWLRLSLTLYTAMGVPTQFFQWNSEFIELTVLIDKDQKTNASIKEEITDVLKSGK